MKTSCQTVGIPAFAGYTLSAKGAPRPGRRGFISGARAPCNAAWKQTRGAPRCDSAFLWARWAWRALRPYAPIPLAAPAPAHAAQLHFGDAFCDAGTFAVCPETGQLFCCPKPGGNNTIAAQCDLTIVARSCTSNPDLLNCACPSNVTYSDFIPYLTAEPWQDEPYNPSFGQTLSPPATCNDTGR